MGRVILLATQGMTIKHAQKHEPRQAWDQSPDTPHDAIAHFPQVEMLGVRYKFVGFEAGTSLVSPTWRGTVDSIESTTCNDI